MNEVLLHVCNSSDSIQNLSINVAVSPGDAVLLGLCDIVLVRQLIDRVVDLWAVDAIWTLAGERNINYRIRIRYL